MLKFHPPKIIQAIFFSFLGTVCHTHPSVITKFYQVLRALGLSTTQVMVRNAFYKAEHWTYTRKRPGLLLTDWEANRYRTIFFSSLGITGSRAEYYDHVLIAELEESRYWTDSLRSCEDLISLLKSLDKYDVKCGLILNSDIKASKILKRLGIREYFDEIFTAGSVGSGLPNPQIMQIALSSFKVRPSRSLLVGSRPDVEGEGAKNANVPYVLVRMDSNDMFELPRECFLGYYVVDSFSELEIHLKQRLRRKRISP